MARRDVLRRREYSKDFNDRHGRVGAFQRKRYGSRRIVDRADLFTTYPYVVLNPVKAGARESAETWFWSSYATTIGLADDSPFVDASVVLAELGTTREKAVAALRRLVAAEAERHVRKSHVRYLVPDVALRGGVL